MAGVSEEEIERLANRLAMLVSDGGEADNAGRAVGALARRLGLTGGQLKAIFMAGAESGAAYSVRVRRLEREVVRLREALETAEGNALAAQREAAALRRETTELHAELNAQRRGRWMRGGAVLAFLALVAAGAGMIAYGPKLRLGQPPVSPSASPVYHVALVHDAPAPLRRSPDMSAPVLTMLPAGTQVPVRQLLWHNLTQWVEVTYQGHTGYVLTTEVDLS